MPSRLHWNNWWNRSCSNKPINVYSKLGLLPGVLTPRHLIHSKCFFTAITLLYILCWNEQVDNFIACFTCHGDRLEMLGCLPNKILQYTKYWPTKRLSDLPVMNTTASSIAPAFTVSMAVFLKLLIIVYRQLHLVSFGVPYLGAKILFQESHNKIYHLQVYSITATTTL